MSDVLLTVGTRKGLFLGRRSGGRWEFDGPHFNAQAVYAVAIDRRGPAPRLLAAGTARTGARRCSTRTTWARRGPNRPGPR